MRILTWPTDNFGDRLNEMVWPKYIQHFLDDSSEILLVGIGSLLNHRLPIKPKKYIFGSGFGHGSIPTVDDSWNVVWVRGKKTEKLLGLPEGSSITDGAVLLGDIFKMEHVDVRYSISFIPHCSALESGGFELLSQICDDLGVHIINPEWSPEIVINHIRASGHVVTEALHGAIVADTFRIPWLPVSRQGILQFKWEDWCSSININYAPIFLPYRTQWFSNQRPAKLSRRIAFPVFRLVSPILLKRALSLAVNSENWLLSTSEVLEENIDRMKRKLASFTMQ